MKSKIFTYVLLTAPVFYQLDYRQRLETELSVPGIAGIAVKSSIETRYRPKTESKHKTNRMKTEDANDSRLLVRASQF